MTITKVMRLLTDTSAVFDLRIWDEHGGEILLQAVTEADADAFIRIMQVAVESHTNETCEVEP